VQAVQQPPQELQRVPLLGDLELPTTGNRDLLQELVRADLRLEEMRIPKLLCKLGEAPDELCRLGRGLELGRGRREEEVPDRWDVEERLDDDVLVIVVLDVVDADVAREVGVRVEVVRRLGGKVRERADLRHRVTRSENTDDVLQGGIRDLVTVGENVELGRSKGQELRHQRPQLNIANHQLPQAEIETNLFRVELQPDVLTLRHTVLVRPTALAPSLEVPAVDQAAVHVDVGERDGADLLEVEVEQVSVDLRVSRQRPGSSVLAPCQAPEQRVEQGSTDRVEVHVCPGRLVCLVVVDLLLVLIRAFLLLS
jgi:hypothetical protein